MSVVDNPALGATSAAVSSQKVDSGVEKLGVQLLLGDGSAGRSARNGRSENESRVGRRAGAEGHSPDPSGAAPRQNGLVTCAKTGRLSQTPARSAFYFATAEECQESALSIGRFEWDGREGPVPQVEVFPGLVRLTAPDMNRREKTANRNADSPPIVSLAEGEPESTGTGIIRGWSRRSRARMVSTMAELDLAPLLLQEGRPAMVTLTYPGEWLSVAPDGATVKGHLQAFFKRFQRAWGTPWLGVWKLEFQRRGAPHFHLLMVPPEGEAGTARRAEYEAKVALWKAGKGKRPRWKSAVGDGKNFRAWLSLNWADIVGHADPEERRKHIIAGTGIDYAEGDRARDPKRAAVYFGKHGSFAAKDYQHVVPESWAESERSVGRFWGYKGLSKVHGTAMLTYEDMLLLGRTLRRYGTRTSVWDPVSRSHRFRPVLRTVYRPRAVKTWWSPAGVPITKYRLRKTTVRARRMTGPMSTGFVLVNDGPTIARHLGRVIESCSREERDTVPPVGLRGSVRERLGLG